MNHNAITSVIAIILIGFAVSCGTLKNRKQETQSVVPAPTAAPSPNPEDPQPAPNPTGTPRQGEECWECEQVPHTTYGYDIHGKQITCNQVVALLACPFAQEGVTSITGFEQMYEEACRIQGHTVMNCMCQSLCSDPVDYQIPAVPQGYQRGFDVTGKVQQCQVPAKDANISCAVKPASQMSSESNFIQACQKSGNTVMECGCTPLCSAYEMETL